MSAPIVYAETETFEIFFPRSFAYLVSDEMAFPPDKYEVFEGVQFRRYQKSRFLDFIEGTALPAEARPHAHPLYHYGIYCLNHLVDVIAPEPPRISYIGMTSR
jgi:hypothetical protein